MPFDSDPRRAVGIRPRRLLTAYRDWQRQHPALTASRHVVFQVVAVLATLLGVSALLRLVAERLLPDIGVPDLPKPALPDWLRYLDPVRYLRPLLDAWSGIVPHVDLPHGPPWLKITAALLLAVGVSVREYRRRTRDREERERQGVSGEDG